MLSLGATSIAQADEDLENCRDWLAKLSSLQGKVEAYRAIRNLWQSAVLDHRFCFGDKVRTWERSRALLHLKNETFVRLDQNTTLRFPEVTKQRADWFDLVRGMVYFISRVPYELNIKTPFVNATIRGTEFAVRVTDEETRIDVFEGQVIAENAKGRLTLGRSQSGLARRGMAPVLKLDVRPEDAVQWTLYYPPVLDLNEAHYASNPAYETIGASLRHYRAGDVTSALATLETLESRDKQVLLLRAGLLLSAGRVDEAQSDLQHLLSTRPKSADALAMQAIIEIARNDKQRALELSREAVQIDHRSPAAFRALSYAQQADFNLDQALPSARKALELGGNNANDWARVAELHQMLGQLRQAKEAAGQAVALQPDNPLLRTVQGFASLDREDITEAKRIFQQAIAADSSAPLPRFGLGLARIRQGDLDGGTEDISIATALDPRNSLMRSYLGKAYYDQKRNKLSETQYGLAKQFDPKDPTPWFYDAIKKQTENRPVEALQDMQKAIELNDNRAVYRSKQLLDNDLAARSAAVGRIFRNLGFEQVALVQGWKSVNTDPVDYSGHRLLADSYSALPRHDIARVSELLQSQLLQPINMTPVQPHLGDTTSLIPDRIGPASSGFNEFNPLFARDNFSLQTSALVGNHDTFGDEVTQSGLWKDFSYSVGQFYYQNNGYRPNNAIREQLVNGLFQGNISPSLNAQVEARHKALDNGDLDLNADGSFDANYRQSLTTDTLRAGLHYKVGQGGDFLASYVHLDGDTATMSSDSGGWNRNKTFGNSGEAQYLFEQGRFRGIAGGGYSDSGYSPYVTPHKVTGILHGNGYLYTYLQYPTKFTWTLGGSLDSVDAGRLGTFERLNPKVGMIWKPTTRTTVRLAAFRTTKRSLLTNQTIEPTQVAGFNQLFDDPTAADTKRYGLGLDHIFSHRLYGGFEISKRDVQSPHRGAADSVWSEHQYRTYLEWTPHDMIAAGLSYQLEEFHNSTINHDSVPNTTSHYGEASVRFFAPSGFSSYLQAIYVNQRATGFYDSDTQTNTLQNEFLIFNFGLGYRFSKRRGIFGVEFRNLFDERFRYQSLGLRTNEGEAPLFTPSRSVFAHVTLSF